LIHIFSFIGLNGKIFVWLMDPTRMGLKSSFTIKILLKFKLFNHRKEIN